MKVTIDGEVNYEVDGWSTHRTIHLKKPIPFTMDDGTVKSLSELKISSDVDDFMEAIFDRYIEYKKGTSYPIKITMELDDRALVHPPDYVNPIIADFHKYDNE
ncbi:MAG: hypothetical protein PUF66_04630 [Clostridium sp.]|nr:hypothetical protein [Clostridium sp.]